MHEDNIPFYRMDATQQETEKEGEKREKERRGRGIFYLMVILCKSVKFGVHFLSFHLFHNPSKSTSTFAYMTENLEPMFKTHHSGMLQHFSKDIQGDKGLHNHAPYRIRWCLAML